MTHRLEEAPTATASRPDYSARAGLPAPWTQALSPAEQGVAAHLAEA